MPDDRLTQKDALEEITRTREVSVGSAESLLAELLSTSVRSWGQGLGVREDGRIPWELWRQATPYVDKNAMGTGAAGGIVIRHIKIDGNDLRHALKERQASAAPAPLQAQGQADSKPRNAGGAPRKYDRDQFHREVIRLANMPDGLPGEPTELIKIMKEWCAREWKEEPADSKIREWVSAIYAHCQN